MAQIKTHICANIKYGIDGFSRDRRPVWFEIFSGAIQPVIFVQMLPFLVRRAVMPSPESIKALLNCCSAPR